MASGSHRKAHMVRSTAVATALLVSCLAAFDAQAQEANPMPTQAPAPLPQVEQGDVASPSTSGGGMNSPGAFGVGIVLTSAGAVGLGVGGWLFSKGSGACDSITGESIPSDAEVDACRSGVTNQVAGVLSMVAGGAFALAGIPLIISGAIPADSDAEPAPRIAVRVAPTSASLEISF